MRDEVDKLEKITEKFSVRTYELANPKAINRKMVGRFVLVSLIRIGRVAIL